MALFDDSRADWGARKPQGPIYTVPISSRTEKFGHWNGGPLRLFGKPHSACLAQVKAIQAEHMHDDPDHGWSDIGYNGLICPHARAIEGRGRDAVGAHCPNHNRTGIALQFMLGKGETATPAMLARAARFFADCETAARHSLRPMGHRDGFATECPGDQVEAWVKAGMPRATSTAQIITPKEFEVADAKDAQVLWTTPLTTKGTLGQLDAGESPLAILSRIGRNLEALIALEKAEASAATVAAAVVAALPKGQTATAHDIAAEIIAQLTPKES